MAQLSCRDVSLGYEGKTVVEELNIEIQKGDYLCVVGENGAGKSTFLKALLGLIAPNSGEIVFGDGLNRNDIGYLPQQTIVQRDFPASCFEIVVSGCLNHCGLRPFYSKQDKRRAVLNMERLGIESLKKRCYRELSGGQQQRVLLARALCAADKMIVLDEPVSGLDAIASEEMYSIIKKLNNEGITVIMVSHDISAATEYANKILHLEKKPLFFGSKEEYLKRDISKKFLGGAECD